MVLTVWLHMLRVFMTGSYKPPREFNWAVGVILMTLTMFLSFTGYLLPWDQLAIWAITVGTNMARAHPFIGSEAPGASLLTIGDLNLVTASSDVRFALLGGRFVGEATLLRFYVLHCIMVPFIAMIFMAVHFWRIRKDGGISTIINWVDTNQMHKFLLTIFYFSFLLAAGGGSPSSNESGYILMSFKEFVNIISEPIISFYTTNNNFPSFISTNRLV